MKTLKILLAASVIAATVAPGVAFAKKKSNSGGSAPTEEQRKRAHAQGLKDCRKQWGDRLHEVRVEKFYGRWSVVCYHY